MAFHAGTSAPNRRNTEPTAPAQQVKKVFASFCKKKKSFLA
jgi:hypothetical protein